MKYLPLILVLIFSISSTWGQEPPVTKFERPVVSGDSPGTSDEGDDRQLEAGQQRDGLPQTGGQQRGGLPQIGGQQRGGATGDAGDLNLRSGDLVRCPIIDMSSQVRRELAPSAEVIRQELQRAIQAASSSSNPACRTMGTSLEPLVTGFSGSSPTCVRDPARCADQLDQVLPLIDGCTENREGLADMATSIALNLTAGTPLGLVSLGVSAFRSFMNLFRGRAERREQNARNRAIAQQRRDVIEAAASCAMMTFYQASVCTPGQAGSIQDVLDGVDPIPTCTDRSRLGTMTQGQMVTNVRTLNRCLNGSATRIEECGGEIIPAASGSVTGSERAACLVAQSYDIFSNLAQFRQRDIPEFLRLARRHHTRQIIQLRDRLAQSQPGDQAGVADRSALVLHCFYGKMARSISDQNPERAASAAERTAQDEADYRRGGPLREIPENERVLIARSAADVENICAGVDRCVAGVPQATSISEAFGPADGQLSQQMCNGVGQFLDSGDNTLNGRLPSMERAIQRAGGYGQSCVARAAPQGQPAGTGVTTQ